MPAGIQETACAKRLRYNFKCGSGKPDDSNGKCTGGNMAEETVCAGYAADLRKVGV